MSYNKNIFLTRVLTAIFAVSIFAFNSQAQKSSPGLADDFFKVTATTVEVVNVDAAEYQNILSLMGNEYLSCQDEDLTGVFGTGSASPLAPTVETAKDVTAIVDEGNKIVDGLINMGSKIWTIVKAGKPVVNINIGPSANAIPQGVKCWDELEKWEIPSVFRVKSKFENLYGFSLAEFQFDVIYTYGGSFNGKGKYLTHVQVFPSDVYAFWMQEFNANVEIASLFNRGTKANPIAGMQVDVKWQLKNFLNEAQQSASIFVSGDGQAKLINSN